MCLDNCSHYRMDCYLLDDGYVSQAEETALAEIELLILFFCISYLLFLFALLIDRDTLYNTQPTN